MELTNCSELGASELVDLRTSGAPQSRSRETLMSDGTLDTELQRWLQWSGSLSSKTDLTLFLLYIHCIDLTHHDPRKHHEGHQRR